ncbi:MAG: type II secretion system protein GspG [Armatimonadetes bacterium]|nr:type II secretion system protein GspG [Armatimonadota bacterium]
MKKLVVALTVLGVVLFFGFIALMVFLAQRVRENSQALQVQQEIERLKQKGEPIRWRDLVPPVPKHLDGTPLYRQAFAQLEKAKSKFPQSVWETYNDQVLQAAQPALKTFRKALDFPHMRLVEKPIFTGEFKHLLYFRDFSRLLVAEAKQQKRNGRVDKAIENYRDTMKLCRRIGDEPFILAFLVQRVIFIIAQRLLWEDLLSDTDASTKLYQVALNELRAWDFERDFLRALQAERCIMGIEYFDWQREEVKKAGKSIPFVFVGFQNRFFWENQLQMLRFYERFNEIARKGAPYKLREVKSVVNDYIAKRYSPRYSLVAILAPTMPGAFEKVNQIYAIRQVTETALSLRLYRSERGRYPESLQALVPKYLPKIPIDPYDGKPIRYRKLSRGFKVWSVGGNGKDEGGMKVRNWWEKGDLVLESKL